MRIYFPFKLGGEEVFDLFQHDAVQFGCFQFLFSAFVGLDGRFKRFQQTLLRESRGENDLHVVEGSHFCPQFFFEIDRRFVIFLD